MSKLVKLVSKSLSLSLSLSLQCRDVCEIGEKEFVNKLGEGERERETESVWGVYPILIRSQSVFISLT